MTKLIESCLTWLVALVLKYLILVATAFSLQELINYALETSFAYSALKLGLLLLFLESFNGPKKVKVKFR